MMWLKKRWQQLWCLHYWHQGFEVDIMPFDGFIYQWHCKKCDKKIERTMRDAPISYIEG